MIRKLENQELLYTEDIGEISANKKKLLKYAKKCERQNLNIQAGEIYQKLLRAFPKNNKLKNKLADLYFEIGLKSQDTLTRDNYLEEAKVLYENIMPIRKLFREYQVQKRLEIIHKILYEPGEKEKIAYKKAKELNNTEVKNPKRYFVLATGFDVKKDVEFVVELYEKAIKTDPKFIPAYFHLGYIYQYRIKDFTNAYKYYVKAIKMSPEDNKWDLPKVNAWYIKRCCVELGKIMFRKKEYVKVISLMDKFCKIANGDITKSYSIMKDLLNIALFSSEQIGALKKYTKYKSLLNNLQYESVDNE